MRRTANIASRSAEVTRQIRHFGNFVILRGADGRKADEEAASVDRARRSTTVSWLDEPLRNGALLRALPRRKEPCRQIRPNLGLRCFGGVSGLKSR
jgi:hypothetical protein